MKEAGKRDEDMVILGGDIVDSAMFASLDRAKKAIDGQGHPYLYYSGNHDFEYGSEYYSEKAYNEYLPRLSELNHEKSYQVKEYDDLIVFAADDDSNKITAEALEAFREVCTKGKPVVLCIHVPIEPTTGDASLLEISKQVWGPSDDGHSRVLLGPNGCYLDETTDEFVNLVLDEQSPVVLVLAGHIHFYHKDMLNDKTLQLATGAALEGKALQITLTPAK
jgi:3',5'-cyclic AMP phosphodiesterase CpdA